MLWRYTLDYGGTRFGEREKSCTVYRHTYNLILKEVIGMAVHDFGWDRFRRVRGQFKSSLRPVRVKFETRISRNTIDLGTKTRQNHQKSFQNPPETNFSKSKHPKSAFQRPNYHWYWVNFETSSSQLWDQNFSKSKHHQKAFQRSIY